MSENSWIFKNHFQANKRTHKTEKCKFILWGAEDSNSPKIEWLGFRTPTPHTKEATMAIKILQSLGICLQEILRILCYH